MEANPQTNTTEIPEKTPQEIERFIAAVTNAVNWAHDHKHAPSYFPEDGTADILAASFLLNPTDEWEAKFYRYQKIAAQFYRNPQAYRATIAAGMSTPELQNTCPEFFLDIDQEEYFPHAIGAPAPQRITPKPAPKVKPSPAHRPQQTIAAYIADHAPSIRYLQAFVFISRHTNNHHSSRGRKIYPYGQDYLARHLEISRRTVSSIFAYLRRHHIIFKRSNENPELHRSATWFVCTSWKQSTYFLDPQHRRPKKGSPGSPRK